MSDEAELQAKIAALTGRIEQHKQHPYAPHHNNRWSPYTYRGGRHGRGGRGTFHGPHKNRTLVVGGAHAGQPAAATHEDNNAAPLPALRAPDAFVSTRRPGYNQLMNNDTFQREQAKKAEQQQEHQVRQNAYKHPVPNQPLAPPLRVIEVEGIEFKMAHDGSKLFRVNDPTTADKETPKKHQIHGVDFVRTKHGNLQKVKHANGAMRPPKRKPQCEHFTKYGTVFSQDLYPGSATATALLDPKRLKHAGTCPYGPSCKFQHDPTKVAICKEWLRNGWCKAGDNCDLSHETSYHRVSACTHFLRGNCTNSACRYPHVNVSTSAPVCRSFATLGYCGKGNECGNRHVSECPDYANHGRCVEREKGKCQLPHIDRAGALRKAAKRQAKTASEDESDVSSDDEFEENPRVVIDGSESDGPEEERGEQGDEDGTVPMVFDDFPDASSALTKQEDFISFR